MNWSNKKLFLALILGFIVTGCATTGSDNSKKYIFYLHGSAEEEEGATEKYEIAVDAVSQGSAKVISEIRGETDPTDYAKKIKNQVNNLLKKGVKPQDITITGFSKGAIIALAASIQIKKPEINYVLLAGCSEMLNEKYNIVPGLAIGRILSIYDVEDEKFGSCKEILNKSQQVTFKEIELDTGKGHKLFRIPKEKFIEQWREPLLEWAEG